MTSLPEWLMGATPMELQSPLWVAAKARPHMREAFAAAKARPHMREAFTGDPSALALLFETQWLDAAHRLDIDIKQMVWLGEGRRPLETAVASVLESAAHDIWAEDLDDGAWRCAVGGV